MRMVGHKPIGNQLYLFSKLNGHPSTKSCTIHSHGQGIRTEEFGRFTVPLGRTIRFYVPKRASLNTWHFITHEGTSRQYRSDSALEEIATNKAISVEQFTEGQNCPDYHLGKSQRSNRSVFGGRTLDENSFGGYADIEKFLEDYQFRYEASDIITIRDRRNQDRIRLSDVIAQLPAIYTEIRCCFCRSYPGTAPIYEITSS